VLVSAVGGSEQRNEGTLMQDQSLLTLDDLVTHLETQVGDFSVVTGHFTAGTLERFYDDLKQQAVTDLLLIPARRLAKDLTVTDDVDTVQHAVEAIASLLSTLVDKTQGEVQQDIMACVHKFPFDDVRQATYLKQHNKLN
jgi:hypothetical protein